MVTAVLIGYAVEEIDISDGGGLISTNSPYRSGDRAGTVFLGVDEPERDSQTKLMLHTCGILSCRIEKGNLANAAGYYLAAIPTAMDGGIDPSDPHIRLGDMET